MAHRFKEYQPYKGDISRRSNGVMIALESGTAFAYAINNLQDRGKFFIEPQDAVYAGQIVGERHGRGRDAQERGHHRERLPQEAADQHACLRLR